MNVIFLQLQDKCCDITSGGGVIPLDESVNDESDNAEIAVGGKVYNILTIK